MLGFGDQELVELSLLVEEAGRVGTADLTGGFSEIKTDGKGGVSHLPYRFSGTSRQLAVPAPAYISYRSPRRY